MNKCSKCGESIKTYVTLTKFGHGDSTHYCHVQCDSCDNKSASFGGWGLFSDKAFREAQADWNEKNP